VSGKDILRLYIGSRINVYLYVIGALSWKKIIKSRVICERHGFLYIASKSFS